MVIGIADFGLWIADCPQAPGQEAEGPLWRRGSSRCARPTRGGASPRLNTYNAAMIARAGWHRLALRERSAWTLDARWVLPPSGPEPAETPHSTNRNAQSR